MCSLKHGLYGIRFLLAGVYKGQSRGPGVARGPSRIISEMMKQSLPHYPVVDPVSSHTSLFAQHRALEQERQHSPGCDIVLGGDHSLTIGSASSTLKRYPGARLIWIDAHADLNTWSSSPSGNMHGMPVASLLGLMSNTNLCSFKDLFYLGLRDVDPFENRVLVEKNVSSLTSETIQNDTNGSIAKVQRFLAQRPPVHLSLDIDVLDPIYAPGTGTPVKNGLTPQILHRLIETIVSHGNVVCVDLVEYNPSFDDKDERTLKQCVEILSRILRAKKSEWDAKHLRRSISP